MRIEEAGTDLPYMGNAHELAPRRGHQSGMPRKHVGGTFQITPLLQPVSSGAGG